MDTYFVLLFTIVSIYNDTNVEKALYNVERSIANYLWDRNYTYLISESDSEETWYSWKEKIVISEFCICDRIVIQHGNDPNFLFITNCENLQKSKCKSKLSILTPGLCMHPKYLLMDEWIIYLYISYIQPYAKCNL